MGLNQYYYSAMNYSKCSISICININIIKMQQDRNIWEVVQNRNECITLDTEGSEKVLTAMLPLQPDRAGHHWASLWLAGWCFSFLYRTGSLCHGIHCVPGSALKPRTAPRWGSEVRRMASSVSPKKPRPLPRSPPQPPGRRAKWVGRTPVMS